MPKTEVVNPELFKHKVRIDIFKKILKNNLKLTNEKLLIIGDKGDKGNLIAPILTNAYKVAAEELGIQNETIYQNFKGRGDYADEIVIKHIKQLPAKNAIIINVSNRLGNLSDLGQSFRKLAHEKKYKFISCSSLGTIKNSQLPLILDSMDLDYEQVSKETEKLRKILTKAKEIQVTTKAGTNITFRVDGVEGKSATGIYQEPGQGGNLPGSEAYIAPITNKTNGTIVIDGSSRIKDTTLLIIKPIKLEIKNGIITKIQGGVEAEKLKNTLVWAHNKALYPERVWKIGEFGIGMNKKAKIIGSVNFDEKAYGTCHFAIGNNYWFGGDIKTIIHLDQVIKDPTIKIDGKILKI